MAQSTISQYLDLCNLQIAAEAFLTDGNGEMKPNLHAIKW